MAAVPILLIGAFEGGLNLIQSQGPGMMDIPRGTYGNRNHLAGLLEMVFPFAVMYAVAALARASGRGFSVRGGLRFCCGAALAAGLVVAQTRTLSRMGMISLLAAAITVAIFVWPRLVVDGRRRWAILCAAGLVVAGVFLLAPPLLLDRFASLGTGDFSLDERVRIWRESLPLIRDFPVFGCGLGGFAKAFVRYRDPKLSFADFAHNDYLQGLIELGPVVWFVAMLSVGFVVVRIWRYASKPHSEEKQFVAIAAVGGLIALLVHGFADYNFYIPANALMFAWIAGIAEGLASLRTHRVEKS